MMSPETAAKLRKGDYVAFRADTDLRNFTHVAIVTKHTAKAFFLAFHPTRPGGHRIPLDNKEALRNLRRADLAERIGFTVANK